MTILDEINNHKRREVAERSEKISLKDLKESPFFNRATNSLLTSLRHPEASGIIAEFKTKSPSLGMINETAEVAEVTSGYVKAGASGLSVLTDFKYFGGSFENMEKARIANPKTPILQKDFVIEPYQVFEAKAHGADLILLIAASLTRNEMLKMTVLAKEMGMEVIVEVHNEEEIDKLNPMVDLVGVNNRNLKIFEVDLETSVRLGKLLPDHVIRISESGLSSVENIRYLSANGYNGFLMGEIFMKTASPAQACIDFIAKLKA
jgi:indole-3-glycerol phosphate synthase